MAYHRKMLDTLEFSKIIDMLCDACPTEGARAMAKSLMPATDYDTVELRQLHTKDAKRLVLYKGYPAFSAPESVPSSADRAYKGAVLSPRDLLDIASLLHATRGLADYIGTDIPFTTTLHEIFARLIPNRAFEDKITRSILSEDMIADEASPALADIRRKIRATNNQIKDALQSYIGGNRLHYLQENIVTMRNGRYVVPVKAEYKNDVKGLVHDTSSTGATLFIEPMSVVNANNELKSLTAEETHEIERILSALSAEAAELSSVLTLNYHNINEIAFYFGLASLAISMHAEEPILSKKRMIDLKRARHPLLDRATVVPIDVSIGQNFETLIITGPNTGGKTVTLKTIGILTVMTACGMQIPADETSTVGIFDGVLVDIGDEQSIEESLSTFSSHMVNIIGILKEVNEKSLVLFDELGAGTDPVEGAALAIAILEKTQAAGALSASTTHYAELKAYALETPRVQNASCEFDIETLRPTYKLIVGTPGKSNAFAISEKLGLDADVIARAGTLIERDNKRFEDVIERLDTDRAKMEKEKEKAEEMRREYESFKQKAQADIEKKVAEQEAEISKQVEKAKQILGSARASSEFIFRQLEEIKKQEDREKRNEMMARAREEISRHLHESEALFDGVRVREVSLDEDYKLPRPLKVGDTVYLVSIGKEGTVTAVDEKKKIYAVTAGIFKTKAEESDLRLVDGTTKFRRKDEPKKVSEGKVKKTLVTTFHPEVDVRGMIGDDAWFVIDKYLDDAIMASVSKVRIIHGKGTGALRAALWKYFKADKRIRSFAHAAYGEGDAGVTVIELKQ